MADDCSISSLALHSYKLSKNEYEKNQIIDITSYPELNPSFSIEVSKHIIGLV